MLKKSALLGGLMVLLSTSAVLAKEYLLEASAGAESESKSLFSRVGVIKDDGTIDWGNKIKLGSGKSPCVAIQGMNAVMVHRGHTTETEDELYYRIGTIDLTTMAATWGPEVKYAKGDRPFVTLRGTRVVEVHQAKDKDKLFISTGTIDTQRKQITWSATLQYDADGRNPSLGIDAE